MIDGDRAVCLPDDWQFEGDEVRIARDGNKVILEPLRERSIDSEGTRLGPDDAIGPQSARFPIITKPLYPKYSLYRNLHFCHNALSPRHHEGTKRVVTLRWCGLRWDAGRRQVIFSSDETLATSGEVAGAWRRDRGVYPSCSVAGRQR